MSENWNLRVESPPAHGAFDLAVLSRAERDRLATFASSERRRQFVMGRLAARRIVGEALGETPQAVRIELGKDGAPRIEKGYVSIAHGGRGFAARGVAVYSHRPVGVDAEAIQPRHPGLASRILAEAEGGILDSLGGASASSLTLIWALKEAVLKGQRTGLRAGARSVRLEQIQVANASGHAEATSVSTGRWELAFERQNDLWIAVACQKGS